ncbi:uncharacterized protein LOC118444103 [Vespa mandarinia]|uniref:uncharacterized protein LOC118444103 n=1 Tax=Vespa mandarinia TaxID=7446 RepID=UPI0016100F59|nr:uncharacterized protein LOC118444103 [Vespa mandarinia]XP_035727918.1 uncharacterized protein LOC118444103 [Vespa mandarinia]
MIIHFSTRDYRPFSSHHYKSIMISTKFEIVLPLLQPTREEECFGAIAELHKYIHGNSISGTFHAGFNKYRNPEILFVARSSPETSAGPIYDGSRHGRFARWKLCLKPR